MDVTSYVVHILKFMLWLLKPLPCMPGVMLCHVNEEMTIIEDHHIGNTRIIG